MDPTTLEFTHNGYGWIATLDTVDRDSGTARLTVRPDCYDDDPGAGSGIVRSAFFEACGALRLDVADSVEIHSGGFYSRTVKPEAIEEAESP